MSVSKSRSLLNYQFLSQRHVGSGDRTSSALKELDGGAHMAQSGIVRNAFPEPKFLSNQTGYRSDLGIKIKLIT